MNLKFVFFIFTNKNLLKSKKENDDTNKPNKESNDETEEQETGFLSLKQAKFDVFKFGIKGFDKEEQQNAKRQLAIKLGAAVSRLKWVSKLDRIIYF